MPTKRKFSAKFPTARIKRIMQLDDEIGKLAATVPPVVSRALELFMEQLLLKAYELTTLRNSKTIMPSHLKTVIETESGFSFLKPLVAGVPPLKSETECSEAKSRRHSTTTSEKKLPRKHYHSNLSNGQSSSTSPNKSSQLKSKSRKRFHSDPSDAELSDEQSEFTVSRKSPSISRNPKVDAKSVRSFETDSSMLFQ